MPRPLHDKVWLLFPESSYRNDRGGIVEDTVVAAGPEVPADFIGVGDRVLASIYDGMPVEHEGIMFRSVPYSDIMAVIRL